MYENTHESLRENRAADVDDMIFGECDYETVSER